MTDVELKHPREDAVKFIKAAMERAPGITSYEMDAGGETFVGRAAGGLLSGGEKVIVDVPAASETDPESVSTTIAVRVEQPTGLFLAANSWKYKSQFMEAVYDLRDRPVDEVVQSVEYREREVSPAADSSETAQAWLLTAKVLMVPLLLVLLVVVLFAVI